MIWFNIVIWYEVDDMIIYCDDLRVKICNNLFDVVWCVILCDVVWCCVMWCPCEYVNLCGCRIVRSKNAQSSAGEQHELWGQIARSKKTIQYIYISINILGPDPSWHSQASGPKHGDPGSPTAVPGYKWDLEFGTKSLLRNKKVDFLLWINNIF